VAEPFPSPASRRYFRGLSRRAAIGMPRLQPGIWSDLAVSGPNTTGRGPTQVGEKPNMARNAPNMEKEFPIYLVNREVKNKGGLIQLPSSLDNMGGFRRERLPYLIIFADTTQGRAQKITTPQNRQSLRRAWWAYGVAPELR
jgi:hypothetical protein